MKKGLLIMLSVAFLATGSIYAQSKSAKCEKAKTECCQSKSTCTEKKACKEKACPAQKTTPAKKADKK